MSKLLGSFSGRRFVQPPAPPPPPPPTISSIESSGTSVQKSTFEGPSLVIESAALLQNNQNQNNQKILSSLSSLTSVVSHSGYTNQGQTIGVISDNNTISGNVSSSQSNILPVHQNISISSTTTQLPLYISLLSLPLYSGCGGGIAGNGSPCVVKFTNARVFLRGKLRKEDLWVRDGRVIDPASRFWEAASFSEFACDLIVDCNNAILAPGLIDVQINGGYGVDFSRSDVTHDQIQLVTKKIFSAGVTSICPTLISSSPETYKDVLSIFRSLKTHLAELNEKCVRSSSTDQSSSSSQFKNLVSTAGSRIIGMHLEGPFLCVEKKGAHPERNIITPSKAAEQFLGYTKSDADICKDALKVLSSVYGPIEWNAGEARIVTIAPELPGALQAVTALAQCGVVASIGHTSADIIQADRALSHGASMVTHLFNAMSAFKQRSPGVVGLLGRTPHGSSTNTAVDAGLPLSSSTTRSSSASKVTRAFEELERVEYVTPFTAIPFRKPELLSLHSAGTSANLSSDGNPSNQHSIRNFYQFPKGPEEDEEEEDDDQALEEEEKWNNGRDEKGEGDDDEDDELIRPALAYTASKVASDLLRRTATSNSSTESKSASTFNDSPVSPLLTSEIPKPNGGSTTPLLGIGIAQRLQSTQYHPDGTTTPQNLSLKTSQYTGEVLQDIKGSGDFKKSFLKQTSLATSPIATSKFTSMIATGASKKNKKNKNKKTTRRNINGAVVTAVHERPYYGLIVDGVHNHPYSVNIAYETHPSGLILVTDAMAALGLPIGKHFLGEQEIEIFHGEKGGNYEGLHAALADNHNTLAGAIVPLDECVRNLLNFTQCPLTHAIATVTKHPAEMLRLNGIIGGLEVGCWADICVIDDSFNVLQTWLAGTLMFSSSSSSQ
jgi:N-acetylglucosamine-6-phosphate deacetylase